MSVLVTGATGFVGSEVARRLLAAGRSVVALARNRGEHTAVARVADALGRTPDGCDLEVVEGDLAWPGVLDVAATSRLRATVETVIHCAGDPSFEPADLSTFRSGHVQGPRQLLAALAGGRLRRWVQVSTAFVCGRRTGLIREDEDDVGQAFHNSYERLKLEAERVLRAEGERRGVDVRVVRPSIVVGRAPATAGGTPANLFLDFVRLVSRLGRGAGSNVSLRIAARPAARFNIVPVEYVVAGAVALAEHPGATEGVFHLVAGVPTQEAMLAIITTRLGVDGVRLVDAGKRDLPGASRLERRVARMLAPYSEYLEQDVCFDDHRARAVLDDCGIARPTLDEAAVDRLIGLALGGAADTIVGNAALTGAVR